MFLSVVIPAYREKENLKELTERLISSLEKTNLDFEILYVIHGDDGSRELLNNFKDTRVKYLFEPKPQGIAKAFTDGWRAVIDHADLILTMDADLNHQPEEIPRLLGCFKKYNSDITIGSRYIAGGKIINMPFWKMFISRLMNKIINFFSGIMIQDKTSGFRIYKKEVIKCLLDNMSAKNFEFLPETILVAHKFGFSFAETPITFIFRVRGESKMYKMQTVWGYLKMFLRKMRKS